MSKDSSFEFFMRAVEERHQIFKNRLDELLEAVSGNDPQKKQGASKSAHESLQHLKQTISQADYPPWLGPIESKLHWYTPRTKEEKSGKVLLSTLIKLYSQIMKQQWNLDRPKGISPVDFDSIYRLFYDESRAPELFEELLKQLQSIVDSGEVDSLKAIQSLEKLISTIRKNMRGSYFSTVGTLHFTTTLFKNYLWEELSKIPAIGSFLQAFSKTLSELDVEMSEVHTKLSERIAQDAKADLPMLKYKTQDIPKLNNSKNKED